jgi:hypothetical protein
MKTTEYIGKVKAAIAKAKAEHGADAGGKRCEIPLQALDAIFSHYEGRIAAAEKRATVAEEQAATFKTAAELKGCGKPPNPMDMFEDILRGRRT